MGHTLELGLRVSLPRYTSKQAQSKRECLASWDGNHWPQTSQLTWHWPCVCLHSIGAEIKLRQTYHNMLQYAKTRKSNTPTKRTQKQQEKWSHHDFFSSAACPAFWNHFFYQYSTQYGDCRSGPDLLELFEEEAFERVTFLKQKGSSAKRCFHALVEEQKNLHKFWRLVQAIRKRHVS